ncbi:MAG: Mannose-1-phosphate guanylyltransferase 1 [Syntrophomonadaceae bacterium]|nr:Mannose-1-phosphate guanylyltransferase 1 [Bacillota bacterium]
MKKKINKILPKNYKIAKMIKKPWGGYAFLEKRPTYWIKKLFINKGEELSLQSHKERYEIWTVLEGRISAQKGNNRFVLNKGEFLKIDKEEKHRISGLTKSCILEVAFGKPKERDIIRYEDKYGRVK